MAKQVFVLTEAQWKTIQEDLDRGRKTRLNSPLRDQEDNLRGQTSDTYVAYPKTTDGIPAMTGVAPGVAECDIYRIVDGATATLETLNQTRMVYNISSNKIDQSWVLVERLKSGQWIVIPTATSAPLMLFKTTADPMVWSEDGLSVPYLNARAIIFNPETNEYDFISEDEEDKIVAYWPQCPQNEEGEYIQCGCGWNGLRVWCRLTALSDETMRWEIVDGISWSGIVSLQEPWIYSNAGSLLPYATAKACYLDSTDTVVYSPQTFTVFNPVAPKTTDGKWIGLPYGGASDRYTVILNDSGYYEVASPQRVQSVFKLEGYWEYQGDDPMAYTPWGMASLYHFNGTNYIPVDPGGGYEIKVKVYWPGALIQNGKWANLPKGNTTGVWGIALWDPYHTKWEVQTVFQPDTCYRGTMKSDWSKTANPVKITLVEQGFDIDAVGWGYPTGTTLKAGDEVIVDYMGDEGLFYFHSDTSGSGAVLFQITGAGTAASGYSPATAIGQKLVWDTTTSKYTPITSASYTLYFANGPIVNNAVGPDVGKYVEFGMPGSRSLEIMRVWAINTKDSNGDDRWEVQTDPFETIQVKMTEAWTLDANHKLAYAKAKLWYFSQALPGWTTSTSTLYAVWNNPPVDSDGNSFVIPTDETGKVFTVQREGLGLYSLQKDSVTCVFKMYDNWVAGGGGYSSCLANLLVFNGTTWTSIGKRVKLYTASCLLASSGSYIALPKGGNLLTMGTCRWDSKNSNWEVINVFNPQQVFRATLMAPWNSGAAGTISILPAGPTNISAVGWGFPSGTSLEAGRNVLAFFMQDEGVFYFMAADTLQSLSPTVLNFDCTTPVESMANLLTINGVNYAGTSWGYPANTSLRANTPVLAFLDKVSTRWYFLSDTGMMVRRALTQATWVAGTTGAIQVLYQDQAGGTAQARGWGYKSGTTVDNGSQVWVASLPGDSNVLYFWSAAPGAAATLYQATSDGTSASGVNPATVVAKPLRWNPAGGGKYEVDASAASVTLYHPLGPRVPDGTSFLNVGISKAGERFWAVPVPGTDGSVRMEIISGHTNVFLARATEAWYTGGTAGRLCKAHLLHYSSGVWQESSDYVYIYNALHPRIDGVWATVPVGNVGDYYLVRESWAGRDSYSPVYEVLSPAIRPRFFFSEKSPTATRNYPASTNNPVSYTALMYEINTNGTPSYSATFEATVYSFLEPVKSTGGFYKAKAGTTGICFFDYASSKFFVESYSDQRELFKAQVAANWDNTEGSGGTLKVTLPPDPTQHDCTVYDFEAFLAQETTITVRYTAEKKLEAVLTPAFNVKLLSPSNPIIQETSLTFYHRKISGSGDLVQSGQPSYDSPTAVIPLSTCPTTSAVELPSATAQAGVLQDLWYSGYTGLSDVVLGTDIGTGSPDVVGAVAYGYGSTGSVILPGTPVVLFEVATDQWVFMPTLTGTWTITVNGETTSALNYNATAEEVRQALLALPILEDYIATGLINGGFPNEGGGYEIVFSWVMDIDSPVTVNTYFSGVVPGTVSAEVVPNVYNEASTIIDLINGSSGSIGLNGSSPIAVGTSGTDIATILTTVLGYLVICYLEGVLGSSPIGLQHTGAPDPYNYTQLVETYNDTGGTLEISEIPPSEVEHILLHYIGNVGTGTGTGT